MVKSIKSLQLFILQVGLFIYALLFVARLFQDGLSLHFWGDCCLGGLIFPIGFALHWAFYKWLEHGRMDQ